MKNIGLLAILAITLALFVVPNGLASGEILLNCSYYGNSSEGNPTDGAVLYTSPEKKVSEPYSTNTKDDITIQFFAMANSNRTNATLTSPVVFYWDNSAYGTVTNAYNRAGTNVTGATNASIIISNASIFTQAQHSYYFEFWIQNVTAYENLTCDSGYTCTKYATDDANYANITKLKCPTRTISIKYPSSGLPYSVGDGVCDVSFGETKEMSPNDCDPTKIVPSSGKKDGIAIYVVGFIVIILALLYISNKKK